MAGNHIADNPDNTASHRTSAGIRDAAPREDPQEDVSKPKERPMFEPIEDHQALTVADQATTGYVKCLLDAYVEAGLISTDTCASIVGEIDDLLRVIHGSLRGEAFWQAFRGQFGFADAQDQVVPVNAANLCPEPKALLNAANMLRVEYNNNVAQQVRTAGGVRVTQIELMRAAIANALGIPGDRHHDLILMRNSSEGNNLLSQGYSHWTRTDDVTQLDTVVVWEQNHPTNLEAWRMRRDWNTPCRTPEEEPHKPRKGDLFELIVVRFPTTATLSEIEEAFLSRIDGRTRFVSYSETSNGNGMRIPEEVVAGIWRKVQRDGLDCHVHIDGTMSWGSRRVNLGNPHCHSYVSSAHKWFLGPKETAMFYMDKRKVENFAPAIFAYDYRIGIPENWRDMPEDALRFEMLGQRDDVNLITLHQTQIMWNALTSANRDPYGRVVHLATLLKQMLVAGRWTLVTPMEAWKSGGVVRVAAPRKDGSPSLYEWIYRQGAPRIGGSGGAERAEAQTFRLCPHIYNTEADIQSAVAMMTRWRELHGR